MVSSRVPKFRFPAAFVSPASLVLIGGVIYYFSQNYTPEEELEATLEKKFPQVRASCRRPRVTLPVHLVDHEPRSTVSSLQFRVHRRSPQPIVEGSPLCSSV